MVYYDSQDILNLFVHLNKEHIRYFVIKNIGSEIPKRLKRGKDIDLCVHPADDTNYRRLMRKLGYLRTPHVRGTESGWQCMYGLPAPLMVKHVHTGIMIDSCNKLCVKSLCMKAWIPLDGFITDSVWGKISIDHDYGYYKLDDKTLLVYLLARCIFDKEKFTSEYMAEIDERKPLLRDFWTQEAILRVFFKFAPNLIRLVEMGDYELIIDEYRSFSSY